MIPQLFSVSAILLSTLVFLTGNGLLTTLIPVRGHLEGFSTLAIGLVGSAYNIGFMLGCLIGPRVLARVGHIRSFAVGAGLAVAMALLQSILIGPTIWFGARALYGFAAATMFMVLESWLNHRTGNENRGQVFAAYMTVNFGGIVIGQLLLATSAPQSFVLFSLSAIFCALCVIPVGLTLLPQPPLPPVPVLKPARMFRLSPVGVAGCIAVGLANGAVWALAPLYAIERGLSGGWIALFMTAFTIGGVAVQVPMGRLSDRMDRRWAIAGTCALAALAGVAMALMRLEGHLVLLGAIGLYGVFMLPLYALSVAHANDRIPREMFVESSATLLLINAGASVLGPTLAAAVMGWFGASSLFLFTAVTHVAMVVFTLVRIRMANAPDESLRDPFAPLPQQASPEALQLDPRGAEAADG